MVSSGCRALARCDMTIQEQQSGRLQPRLPQMFLSFIFQQKLLISSQRLLRSAFPLTERTLRCLLSQLLTLTQLTSVSGGCWYQNLNARTQRHLTVPPAGNTGVRADEAILQVELSDYGS